MEKVKRHNREEIFLAKAQTEKVNGLDMGQLFDVQIQDLKGGLKISRLKPTIGLKPTNIFQKTACWKRLKPISEMSTST